MISLRWRLTLCYGSFFALVLLLFSVLSYTIHARGQYDGTDCVLIASAEQAAVLGSLDPKLPPSDEQHDGLDILFRFTTLAGVVIDKTPATQQVPFVDPRRVLQHPTGPAYDWLTRLVPTFSSSFFVPSDGAFALLQTPQGRWRAYVHPLKRQGITTGYIEVLTPLMRLDAALHDFQMLFPILGLSCLLVVLLGSWTIAAGALRPIATLTQIAQSISLSRDLSRRVPTPPRHDELGHLAATFNKMLASLEAAYQTQQRFVSDASHELRAPLTALQANLELFRRHPTMSAAEREETFTQMEHESARLIRLVSDLLALARADAGIRLVRRSLDLDLLILDAFRIAHQLSHDQHFLLEPFEPVCIEGDADRLKQLFLILLDNAIKYTPAEGQVTLGLRRLGNDAEIVVRDSGIGIASEDQPHIFDRFYRAEEARRLDPSGTGLGLSIASWIAEQHAGTITVESQLGEGTTMHVHLPQCRCS